MPIIRQNISRYRNELKGFAILWVVFFHAQLGLSGLLYEVQRIGYGGVDIFFFLSGFGLYHSLEGDQDLGRYLKRRAERLLPAYLPFCLIWLAVMLPIYGEGLTSSLRTAVGNLSMLGYLAGVEHNINWYVSAMALSLLLAPVFHTLLRNTRRFWMTAVSLVAVLFLIGLAYIDQKQYIMISRMPVFVLGMILAASQAETVSMRKAVALLTGAGVAGLAILFLCINRYQELLITYAMYWHPFVLIVPGLCAALAGVFAVLPPKSAKPFALLGKASFEIFLFNVWVELLGKRYGLADSPADWLFWSAASIAAGCAYHWAIGVIIGWLRKKQKMIS